MSEDVHAQRARASRSPTLQLFLDTFAAQHKIPDRFVEATDHPYDCRCEKCMEWWARMGPEDDTGDDFGPFTADEIERYCGENSLTLWWKEDEG